MVCVAFMVDAQLIGRTQRKWSFSNVTLESVVTFNDNRADCLCPLSVSSLFGIKL